MATATTIPYTYIRNTTATATAAETAARTKSTFFLKKNLYCDEERKKERGRVCVKEISEKMRQIEPYGLQQYTLLYCPNAQRTKRSSKKKKSSP